MLADIHVVFVSPAVPVAARTSFSFRRFDLGTFQDLDVATCMTAVANFYLTLNSCFLDNFTAVVLNVARAKDEQAGGLLGEVAASVDAIPVVGTALSISLGCIKGVGARIAWQTPRVHNYRPVHGSTWIGPLAQNCYGSPGNLTDSVVSQVESAGQSLIDTARAGFCEFVVASVPRLPLMLPGFSSGVTGGICSPIPAFCTARKQ